MYSSLLLAIFLAVTSVNGHSFMSCPMPFNTNPFRGGNTVGPCENWSGNRPVNRVRAGDRLKVGWSSNNHGGGYVRLALVPEAQSNDAEAFKRNVLKQACYGHDQRQGRYAFGDCIHPCNGRPGCQWQNSVDDVERFDTSITIPYNLADGRYVLQWVGLVGNGQAPYYTCSLLEVSGGNPSLDCSGSNSITGYTCRKAGGPEVGAIMAGTSSGRFCYSASGVSNIDAEISKRPVNFDCDPRIGCGLSVNPSLCAQDLSGIADPANPKQICAGAPAPPPPPPAPTTTTTTARPTTTTTVAPRPTTTTTAAPRPTTTTTRRSTTTRRRRTTTKKTTSKKPKPTTVPNSCPPAIVSGSTCDPAVDTDRCSGVQYAQCVFGVWLVRDCAAGTACRSTSDGFACDFPENVPCLKGSSAGAASEPQATTPVARTTATATATAGNVASAPSPTVASYDPNNLPASCPAKVQEGGLCDASKERNKCSGLQYAECVHGKWMNRDCAPGTVCVDTETGFQCDWPYNQPCLNDKNDCLPPVVPEGTSCDLTKEHNKCSGLQYAECVHGKWMNRDCAPGTVCVDVEGGFQCDWPYNHKCYKSDAPPPAKEEQQQQQSEQQQQQQQEEQPTPTQDAPAEQEDAPEGTPVEDTPTEEDAPADETSQDPLDDSYYQDGVQEDYSGASASGASAASSSSTSSNATIASSSVSCPAKVVEGTPCDLTQEHNKCSGLQYAECVHGKWMNRDCAPGTVCVDVEGGFQCDWPEKQPCLGESCLPPVVDEGTTCDLTKEHNKCSGLQYAECVHGKWMNRDCAPGTVCVDVDGGFQCDWPYNHKCYKDGKLDTSAASSSSSDSSASSASNGGDSAGAAAAASDNATSASSTTTTTTTLTGSCAPTVAAGSACTSGTDEPKCSGLQYAECVNNAWVIRECAPGTSCVPATNGGFMCDFDANNACKNGNGNSNNAGGGAAGEGGADAGPGVAAGQDSVASVVYAVPDYDEVVYYTITNANGTNFQGMVTINTKYGVVDSFYLSFDLPNGQVFNYALDPKLRFYQQDQNVRVWQDGRTNITDYSFIFIGTYTESVLAPTNFQVVSSANSGGSVSSLMGPVVAYSSSDHEHTHE